MVEDVAPTVMASKASTAPKITGDAPGWQLAERALHNLGAVSARDEMTSRATF